MNAGLALIEAASAALGEVPGLAGVHEGRPVQSAYPHALVGTGVERDWSHKSGAGRELNLTLMLRDKGERSARLRALAGAAEAAIEALAGEMGGWRLVSLHFLRGQVRAGANGEWTALSEYRARMLKL
jgi:hypothetical protein